MRCIDMFHLNSVIILTCALSFIHSRGKKKHHDRSNGNDTLTHREAEESRPLNGDTKKTTFYMGEEDDKV